MWRTIYYLNALVLGYLNIHRGILILNLSFMVVYILSKWKITRISPIDMRNNISPSSEKGWISNIEPISILKECTSIMFAVRNILLKWIHIAWTFGKLDPKYDKEHDEHMARTVFVVSLIESYTVYPAQRWLWYWYALKVTLSTNTQMNISFVA